MKSKRLIKDLMADPDSWTEDDIEDVKKINSSLLEMKKAIEPYSIKFNRKNDDNIYMMYYRKYVIMGSILETFILSDKVNYKDLIQSVRDNSTDTLFYELFPSDIKLILKTMVRFGYIIAEDSADIYNPVFTITDIGAECNRQQTLQSLAATSFSNYQTFRLNKRVEKMNIIMLIVTVVSLAVAFYSLTKI